MVLEVTVVRLGRSYVVPIPKQIARMLEIDKGSKLKVSLEGDKIVYSK